MLPAPPRRGWRGSVFRPPYGHAVLAGTCPGRPDNPLRISVAGSLCVWRPGNAPDLRPAPTASSRLPRTGAKVRPHVPLFRPCNPGRIGPTKSEGVANLASAPCPDLRPCDPVSGLCGRGCRFPSAGPEPGLSHRGLRERQLRPARAPPSPPVPHRPRPSVMFWLAWGRRSRPSPPVPQPPAPLLPRPAEAPPPRLYCRVNFPNT